MKIINLFTILLFFLFLEAPITKASNTKALVTRTKSDSNYKNTQLSLQLLYDGKNDCGDSNDCSIKIDFSNVGVGKQDCSSDIEVYQFCSARNFCSQLLNECIENQLTINKGGTDARLKNVQENCNTNILNQCNYKFGIKSTSAPDFLGQINTANYQLNTEYQNFQSIFHESVVGIIDNNRYGWFNEICVVKGFESSLKMVLAYETVDGVLGKCIVEGGTYYDDKKCDAGGKAPYCVCKETGPETGGLTRRLQTPREAGLCIDIPLPKVCPAIYYGGDEHNESSIKNSVLNNNYNNNNGVHLSHKQRDNDEEYGHGEFPSSIEGSKNVVGSCGGFWKAAQNNNGINIQPTLDCIGGQWLAPDATSSNNNNTLLAKNQCIRNSCPTITTKSRNSVVGDANDNGLYSNGYGVEDNDNSDDNTTNKGYSHGFALWPQTTKINDFLENVTATKCLTGFKSSQSNEELPTRFCDQMGKWQNFANKDVLPLENTCKRIFCPSLNSEGGGLTSEGWEPWKEAGGASFSKTPASRSSTKILPESIKTGVCNESLGYYTVTEALKPTRECNYEGEWLTVKNACVKSCGEVTAIEDRNNGYALWEKIKDPVGVGESVIVSSKECVNDNYIPNPYSKDQNGDQIMPSRSCQKYAIDSGISVELWGKAFDGCIGECEGSEYDKINGVTTENILTGSITINWRSTSFGEYDYYSKYDDMTTNNFIKDRRNEHYLIRRLCGDGYSGTTKGKWEDPEPMCVANGGQIDNAEYSGEVTYKDNKGDTKLYSALAVNEELSTGICVFGFWKANNNLGRPPKRQCIYKNDTKNIDEVYLKLVDSTQDCEGKKCLNSNANENGASYFPSIISYDDNYTEKNKTITLTCKSSFLKALLNPNNQASNRTTTSPSITCNPNGEWGAVQNECSAPRNCAQGGPATGVMSRHCLFECVWGQYLPMTNWRHNTVLEPSDFNPAMDHGDNTVKTFTESVGKCNNFFKKYCSAQFTIICNDGTKEVSMTPLN
jgi:hypothetical protein